MSLDCVDAGFITTDSKAGIVFRLGDIHSSVAGIMRHWSNHGQVKPTLAAKLGVVVETWWTKGLPPSAQSQDDHSRRWIPAYGASVGVTVMAAQSWGQLVELRTVAADAWAWSGVPGTRGDPHKEARVRYVEQFLGVDLSGVAKTNAGNVADAILLAYWGRHRIKGADYIVAFDPALKCSGYAVVRGEQQTGGGS